jgi:hypothetical protein
MNIFYCILSSIIIDLSCHLTPDTNIVKWRINKLTNKKQILSTLYLAAFTHPYALMQTVCTSDQLVLISVCGSLGTVSCQLTFLFVQENLVPAGAACVIGKLGSCLGCKLSGELNYRENIKVISFSVPFLGLVHILVWVLCWLTDCLNE